MGKTLVHVKNGTITLKMGDKKVKFNINDNMKYPEVAEECSAVYEFIKQPIVEE